MKAKFVGVFLCGIFFFSHQQLLADTPVDEGMLFFDAFASKCASNGPFSMRALGDTSSLQNIVKTVKDDEACKGLDGLIDAVVDAAKQMDFVHVGIGGEGRRNLVDLQRQLTLAFATSVDAVERQMLQQRLAEVQLQLVERPTYDQNLQQQQRELAATRLANYLRLVSDEYPKQINCFEKHKTLPAQLGVQLLAIAGGFFDPTINLAITLAGRLLNSFLNFFNNYKLNKRIEDYRKTTMQAGLGCAMEALEQTICDIQDQAKLVETLIKYRESNTVPEAWMGFDIYENDYPIVKDFLKKVETGADPKSKDQGARRADFDKKQTNFRSVKNQVLGAIGDAEEELRIADQEPDEERRKTKRGNIFRNLISTISGYVFSDNTASAYSEVIPGSDKYSVLTIWLRINTPTPAFPDGIHTYAEMVNVLDQDSSPFRSSDAVIKQDIDQIRETFKKISSDAEDRIIIEREKTINPDKEGALFEWTAGTSTKPSPGVLMAKISEYLGSLEKTWNEHPDWFPSPEEKLTQVNLVISTKVLFDQTLAVLKNPLMPSEKLNRIYDIMQLREQDQTVSERMRKIVEQDLIKRLKDGFLRQDPEILDTSVRLATKSLTASLSPGTAEAHTAALTHIQEDILKANGYANANIMHFYKHYRETLIFVLEYLRDVAFTFAPREQKRLGKNRFQVPLHTPEGYDYSRLCILALNDPDIDTNDDLLNLCAGRELSFKRETGEIALDPYKIPLIAKFDDMIQRDTMDRLCVYRRFSNRRDLYELLRQRPSAFFENFSWPPANSSGQ